MTDFPSITLAMWHEKVRQELKGGNLNSVITQESLEGRIKALYTAHDSRTVQPSTVPLGQQASWRSFAWFDQACLEDLNRDARADIAGGIQGLDIYLDSWIRYDGQKADGAPIWGVDPWLRTLEGIDLHQVALHLHSGSSFLSQAAVLSHVMDKHGITLENTRINWGADPFGSLISDGKINRSVKTVFRDLSNLIRWVEKTQPNGSGLKVSGLPYHMAGATIVTELGLILSNILEVTRRLDSLGVPPNVLAAQLEVAVPIGPHVFRNIAKLRALRLLTSKLFQDCGVTHPSLSIYALTSPRMMSRWDPWVNMLRASTASFAAVAGGADSICILPYDHRLKSSSLGRRVARNVHPIMAEECRMDVVLDPACGSHAIEAMTHDYCERAWNEFRVWENKGGFLYGIDNCSIRNALHDSLTKRIDSLKCGKIKLTGVSSFPNANETAPIKDILRPQQRAVERERHSAFCQNRGEGPTIGGNKLSRLKLMVAEDATVLDLEGGLGFLNSAMTLGLDPHFDSDLFEDIRESVSNKGGAKVYLATIGPQAKWKQRVAFAQNHFATGGFDTMVDSGADVDDPCGGVLARFQESGCQFVCLCAPNQLVQRHGKTLHDVFKEFGINMIVAGKGLIDGVAHEIYNGCDIYASLSSLLEQIE